MPEPYCLAMVLCDDVYADSASGKKTLLGTFSTVGAEEFPTKLKFVVYYALTDCPEEFELAFRIVNSIHLFDDEVEPIFGFKYTVTSPSPLAVLEGEIGILGQLDEPGVYHCELLHNEAVLMSRRLLAIRPSDLQRD